MLPAPQGTAKAATTSKSQEGKRELWQKAVRACLDHTLNNGPWIASITESTGVPGKRGGDRVNKEEGGVRRGHVGQQLWCVQPRSSRLG